MLLRLVRRPNRDLVLVVLMIGLLWLVAGMSRDRPRRQTRTSKK